MCLIEDNFEAKSTPVLGGDGTVVIIDSIQVTTSIQPYQKHLIGFAELKAIPVCAHFEYTESNNNIDLDEFVTLVKSIVVPGSWIVFEDRIFFDDYPKLLSDSYPIVLKRSQIEQHNTDEKKTAENLTVVWSHALNSMYSNF